MSHRSPVRARYWLSFVSLVSEQQDIFVFDMVLEISCYIFYSFIFLFQIYLYRVKDIQYKNRSDHDIDSVV